MTRRAEIEQQIIARVKHEVRHQVWSQVTPQIGEQVCRHVEISIWNQVDGRIYDLILGQAVEDTDGANISFHD